VQIYFKQILITVFVKSMDYNNNNNNYYYYYYYYETCAMWHWYMVRGAVITSCRPCDNSTGYPCDSMHCLRLLSSSSSNSLSDNLSGV